LKTSIVLALGMMLSFASYAAQVRDTTGAAHGTGIISGIVVSADQEARPVRKARVTCGSQDVPGHTTITDDAGRFVFVGLTAGRYTIAASKASWVTMAYGAKRAMRPGSAIPLADGQKVEIVVRLPHGSVITGVVLDQNNEPASNAQARAMRYAVVNGQRRLVSAGNATTDDRGTYRIFGLTAGDYLVGAEGREGSGDSMDLRLTSDADVRHATNPDRRTPPPADRNVTLAMTYFPGSTMASQAGIISVQAGEERSGVDFVLQLLPTAHVEGNVSLPGGGPPPFMEVALISLGPAIVPGAPFETFRLIRPDTDGSFKFTNVSPGQYTVFARGGLGIAHPDGSTTDPTQLLWASTNVAVECEHITGLSLSLEPGLSISGQVRFEGRTLKPPADLRSIRVRVTPQIEGGMMFVPEPVNVSADGRFTIPGAAPGRYRLTTSFPGSGRPGGWLAKSITAGGQDALDAPFTLQPNTHLRDATITFTERLAQLKGTLRTGAGAVTPEYNVVLFPADPSLWLAQSRRIQSVRPSADGAYVFRNVPAGDYLVAAVDDVEPGEWFDPAFLQRTAASAARITIGEGEQKAQDIRVGG